MAGGGGRISVAFDRRVVAAAGLGCFIVPFAVYLATLAPTLSWRNEGRDGGDLISAICTLGIPHPPGYPLYTLLGKLFSTLPLGDVAYRINLMSAFFGAAAVAAVFLCQVSLWRREPHEGSRGRAGLALALVPAVIGGLAFAFSRTFWSQATIAEVYTLGALLNGLALLLVLGSPSSAERPRAAYLIALGTVAGLSLGHHLANSLWLVACGTYLVLRRPAWLWRPRTVAMLAGGLALGLAPYLYLPVRAAAHPAANWGDPQTLAGFLWVVTAEPYRGLAFGMPLDQAMGRIPALAGLLVQQFNWLGVALGLTGIWAAVRAGPAFLAFSLLAFLSSVAYAEG